MCNYVAYNRLYKCRFYIYKLIKNKYQITMLTTTTTMITHRFWRDAEIAISSKLPVFDSLKSATRTRDIVADSLYSDIVGRCAGYPSVKLLARDAVTPTNERSGGHRTSFCHRRSQDFCCIVASNADDLFPRGVHLQHTPTNSAAPPQFFFSSWGCTWTLWLHLFIL